jgi:chromosome segregation ATPase
MASEEYENTLKENLRKLSALGAEVEEIGVSERIFEKLNELELALHKLQNQARDFITGRETKELRKAVEEKVERWATTLEAKTREQELAAARLAEAAKGFVGKDQWESLRAALEEARASLQQKLADVEAGLKADVKGLSDVDAEVIEDLSKMETLLARLDEHDLSLQKLRDQAATFTTEKDLLGLRESLAREEMAGLREDIAALRAALERKAGSLEESLRADIQKLSEVDGGLIARLEKLDALMERVNDQGVQLKKLNDVYGSFVDRKALEDFRDNFLKEEVDTTRAALESRLERQAREQAAQVDSLAGEIKRLAEVSREFAFKQEVRVQMDERVGALERNFKEAVKTLSQVDGRIIEDLARIDPLGERVREQEVSLKKLADIYEGFVTDRALRELRADLERRLDRGPRELEARVQELEARLAAVEGRRRTSEASAEPSPGGDSGS